MITKQKTKQRNLINTKESNYFFLLFLKTLSYIVHINTHTNIILGFKNVYVIEVLNKREKKGKF
jgi:hypothetical protein